MYPDAFFSFQKDAVEQAILPIIMYNVFILKKEEGFKYVRLRSIYRTGHFVQIQKILRKCTAYSEYRQNGLSGK